MAKDLQRRLRLPGNLRDVAFGETAQRRNCGIVPHQPVAREKLRQQQIVDDKHHAGEALEQSGGLRIFEMTHEQ